VFIALFDTIVVNVLRPAVARTSKVTFFELFRTVFGGPANHCDPVLSLRPWRTVRPSFRVMWLPLYLWAVLASAASFTVALPYSKLRPDISILGLPKCGTTQVYQVLRSHPDVHARPKEVCQNGVTELPNHFSDLLTAGEGQQTVNACLSIPRANHVVWYMKRVRREAVESMKFIFLARDPADRLWASYNYWVNEELDTSPLPPTHHISQDFYRSREMFHELVVSEGKIRGGYNLTDAWMRDYYQLLPLRRLIGEVGAENILFIDSDSMDPADPEAPTVLVHKLHALTGLRPDGFNKEILGSRANVGIDPRYHSSQKSSHGPLAKGQYKISGLEPLLPQTRAYIYSRFYPICDELFQLTGIRLERCLAEGTYRTDNGNE